MAIDDDEVCIDDLDDFEKLRHRCKDYKKIITTLTFDVENAKHDYEDRKSVV